jgi:hypothetical protein
MMNDPMVHDCRRKLPFSGKAGCLNPIGRSTHHLGQRAALKGALMVLVGFDDAPGPRDNAWPLRSADAASHAVVSPAAAAGHRAAREGPHR